MATSPSDREPTFAEQESAKERTSIKLMDLPMKEKHTSQTVSSKTSTFPHSSITKPTGSDTSSSASKTKSAESAHMSSSSSSNPKKASSGHAATIATKTAKRTPQVDIESDSDPTFLPAEDAADQNQLEQEMDRSTEESDVPSRVGSPSHYETREERQVRIRRQFNQLDEHRSGFLDANSLVGFFAEVTPDKDVQRRYADELLQLCHSRKLYRHKNGHHHQGNTSGSSEVSSEESAGDLGREGSEGPLPDRHNGRVPYADFQVFVEEKEERLWNLFREIDHNNDNEIQADELQASLAKAGIDMSDADLKQFIKAMDKDGDGAIDFEEWRDFLVLLPREPTLKEIYNYVQEVVAQVGVDGDVVMPPSENDYVARYLLAGAIAGGVSRTVTAPLDRLKVYLITNSVPALAGPAAQASLKNIPKFSGSSAVAPVKQRLLWNAITELYQQGGLKTFFRGNGLNIIKIAPESAIKFYTYETTKWFIATHLPGMTVQPLHNNKSAKKTHPPGYVPEIATSGRFLAGGIAGLVSQFSIYPLETIKTRIMASTGGSSQRSSISASSTGTSLAPVSSANKLSIRTVAKEMWKGSGWRAFYRGLGPSLVGIFPYAAIDLSVFETLKFGYMRWKAGVQEGAEGSEEKSLERPSVFVLLACGTISGSVGATSVYPLSLVRTRLQAQGTPQHPQTYTSTLDVFRKTFEKDGIRGFYKGMVPTLTKVVPAVSISYVVYEYSKRELGL
ncbi:solute carrier family 25 (mitochondrial phosphate transporter), member 23/24/25/41 [Entomortierella parvispora]|uniref:Solute carrier family 25 (Mitochondrial phosphate transporter), member 23/24/25/41 n=1 Tax=Entomortierella parvispora TaxID=205924 RepID=A0A9P3HA59_9FUNG|nr:solute carrier family 25 (mitochondrial phosphate transporter), member 23/24/25/41 [Entomortierella parvispora]